MIQIDSAMIFDRVMAQIKIDPSTKEMAEEYQRVYGTLSDDDLKKIYTI
jgi:hypothetical protein